MGRSKFPGKPSKHCHRKRVNVLPPTGELSHESDSSSVTVIGASKENKQDEDLSENEGESTSQTQKSKPLRNRLARKLSTNMRKNGRQRNFISKIRGKATLNNNRAARNSLAKGLVRKDTTNFAGKFVLPTRSVHSSRVIKPNKRFIDLNETLSVKKKALAKRPIKVLEDKTSDSDTDFKDKLAFSNGHRVILRQARLKLPNQIGTQGPFSTNLHNGPCTIICGVCGAIRYYRFVKQARKFNIYSCELCRKFISKQIKRQSVGSRSTNVLPCLMGQGACYVPPVVRSQHWKITKCAYRSRCPACWLKMCLKAYLLPPTLKQNLTQLLPKNMRGIDFSFSNSLPPILWQKNIANPLHSELATKQRPVRFKGPQKSQVSVVPVTSDVKRQKIDLKGPRVKHVCRSASIVLGQPIAIFGTDNSDKKSNINSPETISDKNVTNEPLKISDLCKVDSPSGTDEDIVSNSGSCKSYTEKIVLSKKERTKSCPLAVNKEVNLSPQEPQVPTGILLDYSQELNLENCCTSGFSLIGSEVISTSAICFLCGSAGAENILVCSVCCEPCHTFCLENCGARVSVERDWVCMRCTPCQDCKEFDRSKISCPKCLKVYHSDCFSSNSDSSSPKVICKECTKCQDCGTAIAYNLSSFPGNMPLCLNCIDKRKVGMHCPICQLIFNENIAGAKMLECSKCKKWVHAECEKLTSEQYDILKLLPVSTSFTCSQCLTDSNMTWRRSVQNELYHRFSEVLRLLIKNKLAKSILKQVGVKGSQLRTQKLTCNLDIDNNNYNKDIDKIYSFEESERLQKESNSSVNTLMDIKYRLCEYNSVKKFNNNMTKALKLYESEQILVIYTSIFETVFPWFCQSHEAAETVPQVPYYQIRFRHQQNVGKIPILPGKEKDSRRCVLCQSTGDGVGYQESRLLYCGNNMWVHANCAYWSTDVYEEVDNHLQNVIPTIERSRTTRCFACDKPGASLQCHLCRMDSYHFMCARKADFRFTKIGKACFCSKHSPDKPEYVFQVKEDFELNCSLFIQQSQEVLRSDPEKVTCLVGSLHITSLGKIEPVISDTSEAIIPTGFICSKVFWSTREPWRLVTYVITTSIQNPNCTTLTVDKNFTVNHALTKENVEQAMKELNDWRRVWNKKSEEVESEDEEERNGPDLLSPELTDTILEDLPHDILDGISVQDIFPNFSYEDMLSLDNSNAESIADSLRKADDEDSTVETPDFKSREWVRTKSETAIKPRVPPLSLTLSYKLDSTIPPITKKRKISRETPSNMLLLQVDGAFDDDSSSDCGSPVGHCSIDPWALSEEPVTCEKCQCTYRTQASYKRHLDSCEMLCTSESDSENAPEQEMNSNCEGEVDIPMVEPVEITVQVGEPPQPVLIQAFESYQSQVHTSVMNVVPDPAPPPQPVTMQPTITIAEAPAAPATISIPVPLCVGPSLTSQMVQPSIDYQQVQQTQSQPMSLQPMQQLLVQRPQPARREPMVLQQIQPAPTPGYVPFVDAFGQAQANQSVQYVQIAPQVQQQPQLLQIRPDGNVIGILPSIQPTTVIVQQPQQLVLDSNGHFGWAQQAQPQIYYGFETIVQNTVMQSQQFLPTPVPGVLTANSSYSTTTQVFQTSKLEPVLDVSSNSFVLVNSGQLEIPQQYPHSQPVTVTSQAPTLIYSQPSISQKPIAAAPQNCISLPTAPFLSDQNIPMNIVPPIPKPPTSHGRPMSRVLPMPTNTVRGPKKIADATKMFPEAEKPQQFKMEDKFRFSKDLMKIIDTPKARNRKFEILDYKVIRTRNGPSMDIQQTFKVEEKPFKEFEPVGKIAKLSTYEPLKEIEKVKTDIYEEPTKALKMLNDERYLKLDNIKTLTSLEDRLKTYEILHLQNDVQKTNIGSYKPKLEVNVEKYQMENSLQKLEDSLQRRQMELNLLELPKLNLESICKKNNVDITIQKSDNMQKTRFIERPVSQVQNRSVEVTLQKVKSPEAISAVEVKKPPEKLLDMPKLENFIKMEGKQVSSMEGKRINEHAVSFNIRSEENCKVEPPVIRINHQSLTASTIEIPKRPPQPQEEENSKKVDEKPHTVVSSFTPGPKPQLKKEPEPCGAPSLLYTMENKEEGFKCSSASVSDCWAKVMQAVQSARAAHNMPLLPVDKTQLKTIQVTGLESEQVKYLIEQLPGASKCVKYKPLFTFTPGVQDDFSLHDYGAARCRPHTKRNTEPYDMFSWLSSKHREPCMSLDSQIVQSRRVNSFPMAMKFRNLKQTSKWSVGVYRSKIHGKGLFCLRDIEAGEMVIEYAGEVIRSILTDKREKLYNSKGIGCYMFRVDDNFVVDATMKGNAARFINHSCDPNCYSKVVEIVGHKHIIIFALRKILSGEELTYDYKFPFEEDKIPCTCGARKCRKFLN